MKLEHMPTKELLDLHNRVAEKPAVPKTFATRGKLVARMEQVAAEQEHRPHFARAAEKSKATAQRAEPKADVVEAAEGARESLMARASARSHARDPDRPRELPVRTGGRDGQRADRGCDGDSQVGALVCERHASTCPIRAGAPSRRGTG